MVKQINSLLSFFFLFFASLSIPCIPGSSSISVQQAVQQLHGLCKYQNLNYPGHSVWDMDKMNRKVLIAEGSYGRVYLLPNGKVYKEMKIENPENVLKAYMEVAVGGCLNQMKFNFASAKDCYYFKTGRVGGDNMILTIWLLMDKYPMNLKTLFQNKFGDVIKAMNFSDDEQLMRYKLKIMHSLAHQLLMFKTQQYNDTKLFGIQHRDIKPENIFLDDNFMPHFGDFGFATFGPLSFDKLGTPEYSAPEMCPDSRTSRFGFEIDVFSLGVLFYEIVNTTPSTVVLAGNHFDMREGRQKPFFKEDFPGFRFVHPMVDQNPLTRATIEQVCKTLDELVKNKCHKQLQVIDTEFPHQEAYKQKKMFQIKEEASYIPTVMEQMQRMDMEMKMMKKQMFNQEPKDTFQQKFEGFHDQMRPIKMDIDPRNMIRKNQFGEAFNEKNQNISRPSEYRMNRQEIKRVPKRQNSDFNMKVQGVETFYPNLEENPMKYRRQSIAKPAPNRIHPSQKMQADMPSGQKVLNDRENFRKKIFDSQIQLFRSLV